MVWMIRGEVDYKIHAKTNGKKFSQVPFLWHQKVDTSVLRGKRASKKYQGKKVKLALLTEVRGV